MTVDWRDCAVDEEGGPWACLSAQATETTPMLTITKVGRWWYWTAWADDIWMEEAIAESKGLKSQQAAMDAAQRWLDARHDTSGS